MREKLGREVGALWTVHASNACMVAGSSFLEPYQKKKTKTKKFAFHCLDARAAAHIYVSETRGVIFQAGSGGVARPVEIA